MTIDHTTATAGPGNTDKLWTVSRQFEAVFANQMISAMRNTVMKDGYVPESHAEKIYQSILDLEHAERIAATDQLGLAKIIHEQLLRTQNGG
ncbi:MAG: rod-binding protein [Deltaproteobacteria bacterium]|nr:rod-binding protein [Deltaproteobacteria bacterium]